MTTNHHISPTAVKGGGEEIPEGNSWVTRIGLVTHFQPQHRLKLVFPPLLSFASPGRPSLPSTHCLAKQETNGVLENAEKRSYPVLGTWTYWVEILYNKILYFITSNAIGVRRIDVYIPVLLKKKIIRGEEFRNRGADSAYWTPVFLCLADLACRSVHSGVSC